MGAKQAKFARAMLVTAVGNNNNYYSMSSANMIGIAIAFIAWIYVFKKGFKTGWIRALGIGIAAIVVFVIIGIIIAFIITQLVPHAPPPSTIVPPMPFQQV